MKTQNDFICALSRVETAVRCLLEAKDKMPGDDLGQAAYAICWIELRAAIKAIDDFSDIKFDAKSALEEIVKQYNEI